VRCDNTLSPRTQLAEEKPMVLRRTLTILLALTAYVGPCFADGPTDIPLKPGQIILEVVGQVNNSGANSVQFGYAAKVAGIGNPFSTDIAANQNESSARFTFYTVVANQRVTTNGPLTTVVRDGTTTLYLNSSPASFDTPDSFRSGTPIQVSTIHQQVIVDNAEKTFTVVNMNTVTATDQFWLDETEYELGDVGQMFRTQLVGVLKVRDGSVPPPTGYFSGYAVGVKK
jgi:hypothetical protein